MVNVPDNAVVFLGSAHSVFCGECGGWEAPALKKISDHAYHLLCGSCGTVLLGFRRREP